MSGKEVMSFFCEQLKTAHQLLEGTMADVTVEMAHWSPAGLAHPVGANYAHVVFAEDGMVNRMLKGGAPLFWGALGGKAGVSELPPMPNPQAPGFPDWSAWARRVRIDPGILRPYGQAVFASSEAYCGSLRDDDLNRSIDLSILGLGKSTLKFLLVNGLQGHALTHCGEIACLKGLQGKKGCPL